MADNSKNPLGMVRDPFAGDFFILPETLCTEQRKIFFRRAKEIQKFLIISEIALIECKNKYEQLLSNNQRKPDTPLRFTLSDGRSSRSAIMPVRSFLSACNEGVEFLHRQVFVMFYGSWETYLFEIIERSFLEIGISDKILNDSIGILMGKKWDGKFCKMQNDLGIDYKAGDLVNHFTGFEMKFGEKTFKNPFHFLDELTLIRHKIIHASSMLDKDKPIFINAQMFPAYHIFFARLTEYVDRLFSEKFKYTQVKINPAAA